MHWSSTQAGPLLASWPFSSYDKSKSNQKDHWLFALKWKKLGFPRRQTFCFPRLRRAIWEQKKILVSENLLYACFLHKEIGHQITWSDHASKESVGYLRTENKFEYNLRNLARFVNIVKDRDYKSNLVLHSDSMSAKRVENVCSSCKIKHQLGRTCMLNSFHLCTFS